MYIFSMDMQSINIELGKLKHRIIHYIKFYEDYLVIGTNDGWEFQIYVMPLVESDSIVIDRKDISYASTICAVIGLKIEIISIDVGILYFCAGVIKVKIHLDNIILLKEIFLITGPDNYLFSQ